MTDTTYPPGSPAPAPAGPAVFAPVAGVWRRLSPALVPVLAVITALIVTVPLMVVTGAEGDIGRGLRLAGTAYSSLLEGSLGLALNPELGTGDVAAALTLAESQAITRRDLLRLASQSENIVAAGEAELRAYNVVINRYLGTEALPDEAAFTALGAAIPALQSIGAGRLRDFEPVIVALAERERREVSELARTYAIFDQLDDEQVAAIIAFEPAAAAYEAPDLLALMQLLQANSIVGLTRLLEQVAVLDALGLEPNDADATAIAEIVALQAGSDSGVARAIALNTTLDQLENAGVRDVERLANQLRLTLRLYDTGLIAAEDVAVALRDELPPALEANLVVLRPKNRVLVDEGASASSAVLYDDRNTPDDTSDDVPDVAYTRLGGQVLLFFPANLETTLTRSIPFVIAGLAVALGFKAGLFNIGAEGQLYIGATLAAWVGYAAPWAQQPRELVLLLAAVIAGVGFVTFRLRRRPPPVNAAAGDDPASPADSGRARLIVGGVAGLMIAGLFIFGAQSLFHITLMLLAGLLGGALWGFIPGALKAFTGAHEVISTIMLNFVAIRLVDWLIKSNDPVILRDLEASAPRTPTILPTAQLPDFNALTAVMIVGGGVLLAALLAWGRREAIQRNALAAAPALLWGGVVIALGFFLEWINVRGNLHVGLILMVVIVWFVDWFLERTTPGFELRTVGANPDAARYAGMSVRGNTVLALTLSGALVGLAGTIQISGVQLYMEPDFFAGLGFDSIAVALLARNNPRAMIPAGILWGGLLTGSGLMQERAELSSDLVKIIQALIIMFIAADAIVRYLYRLPKAGEARSTTFSKGWGG